MLVAVGHTLSHAHAHESFPASSSTKCMIMVITTQKVTLQTGAIFPITNYTFLLLELFGDRPNIDQIVMWLRQNNNVAGRGACAKYVSPSRISGRKEEPSSSRTKITFNARRFVWFLSARIATPSSSICGYSSDVTAAMHDQGTFAALKFRKWKCAAANVTATIAAATTIAIHILVAVCI